MATKESIVRRLKDEKDALLEHFSTHPPSVGNGVFVEYPEAIRQEFEIGQFGYADLDNGSLVYYAAPQFIQSPAVYKLDEFNFFDKVESWVRGSPLNIPMSDVLRGVSDPIPVVQRRSKSHKQETALISHLVTLGPVCLVNPADGAIYAAAEVGGTYHVHISSTTFDVDRYYELTQKEKCGSFQLVDAIPDEDICYLGKRYPARWFPNSVWMIPDPFDKDQSVDQVVKEKEHYYQVMKHTEGKKFSRLDKVPTSIYYPPGLISGTQGFWVASMFDLSPAGDWPSCDHHPRFFVSGVLPEWTEVDGVSMRVKDGVVYDIEGEGTYLSRRGSTQLYSGLVWAPLSKHPTPLTCFVGSKYLVERPGFTQEGDFCVVSRDPYCILPPRGISTKNDRIIHSYDPQYECEGEVIPCLAGYAWRVSQEVFDKIIQGNASKHTSITDWGGPQVIPTSWIDNLAYHFRPDPQGVEVFKWLPSGEMNRIQSFIANGVTYIFLPKLPPGYVFPGSRDLNYMAPELSTDLVVFDPHTQALYSQAIENESQVKTQRSMDMILGQLSSKKRALFVTPLDKGLTTAELIRGVPANKETLAVQTVNKFLMTQSDVFRWSGTGPSSQWVHIANLEKLVIDGIRADPPNSWDLSGQTYASVLSTMRGVHRSEWTFCGRFESLYYLRGVVELNGGSFFSRRLGPHNFTIKVSWFY